MAANPGEAKAKGRRHPRRFLAQQTHSPSAPDASVATLAHHPLSAHLQSHAPYARSWPLFVINAIDQAVRQFNHARIRPSHRVDLNRTLPRFAFVFGPMERRSWQPMGQKDDS